MNINFLTPQRHRGSGRNAYFGGMTAQRVTSHPDTPESFEFKIPSFHDRAGCNSSDPIEAREIQLLFFSGPESRTLGLTPREREAKARAICAQCPVLNACHAWVLENDVTQPTANEGIWAGLTRAEREKLRRTARAERGLSDRATGR